MTTRHRHRPRIELTADQKARLRKVYVDSDMPVDAIRQRFGIAARTIEAIARREGWPLRPGRWDGKQERAEA